MPAGGVRGENDGWGEHLLAGQTCVLGFCWKQTREVTSQRAPAQSREAWAIGKRGDGWVGVRARVDTPPAGARGEEAPGWALCQNGHSQSIRPHVIYYNELHSMT